MWWCGLGTRERANVVRCCDDVMVRCGLIGTSCLCGGGELVCCGDEVWAGGGERVWCDGEVWAGGGEQMRCGGEIRAVVCELV